MSYTHWVDHDHRVMNCVVRWDKTWTPTLDALHVLHGIITGAHQCYSHPRSAMAPPYGAVQWHHPTVQCSGTTLKVQCHTLVQCHPRGVVPWHPRDSSTLGVVAP